MENSLDILNAVVNGDQKGFQELYRLYVKKVYNTALLYVQNELDAEEITQDVFTKIYRRAHTFQGNSAVGTWIHRITVNTSLNYVKKKKRFALLDFSRKSPDRTDFDHPGVLLENRENARILFAAIQTLPDSQKTAFILSYIEDLPRKEVSEVMETSLKAVESLLQRAKKNLRVRLSTIYEQKKK